MTSQDKWRIIKANGYLAGSVERKRQNAGNKKHQGAASEKQKKTEHTPSVCGSSYFTADRLCCLDQQAGHSAGGNTGNRVGSQWRGPTTSDDDGDQQQEPQIPVLPEEESWKIVLVNSSHALPDGYVPEMTAVDNTSFQFDVRAAEDLNAMLRDARAEGLSPMICSSYRTWERQTTLFEKQVEKRRPPVYPTRMPMKRPRRLWLILVPVSTRLA